MTDVRWYDNDSAADAVAAAETERKPLLVDFWSPTCSGCAKLFAVTYPDARVRALLAEHFVCVKYDTKRPNEWFRRLNGPFAHHWHPNVVVLDHRLAEVRRFIGYLPPDDFVAQLEVGRALVALYHQRPREALEVLEGVTGRLAHTHAAPEAQYWAGVAAYRAGGGLAALTPLWERIGERWPDSEWATRADCLDVRIPPGGFSTAIATSIELVARA
jgi:hypothetical protein